MVMATVMGPILAVQAQKAIENFRANSEQKLRVFTQLMATRAARVSPEHVRAINLIDITFFGERTIFGIRKRSKTEQAVLDAWKEYHDHLNQPFSSEGDKENLMQMQREELFTNLMYEMSRDVGFNFDRILIKRGSYFPIAHENLENEERAMRKAIISGLSGERPLQMQVTSMPSDPQSNAEIRDTLKRLVAAAESIADEKSSSFIPKPGA